MKLFVCFPADNNSHDNNQLRVIWIAWNVLVCMHVRMYARNTVCEQVYEFTEFHIFYGAMRKWIGENMVAVYYCELHTLRTQLYTMDTPNNERQFEFGWLLHCWIYLFTTAANSRPFSSIFWPLPRENWVGFNFYPKSKMNGKLNENYFVLHSRESDLDHNGQHTRSNWPNTKEANLNEGIEELNTKTTVN